MKNISVHDLYLDAIEIAFEYYIKWSSVVIENNDHFVPSMPCNSYSLFYTTDTFNLLIRISRMNWKHYAYEQQKEGGEMRVIPEDDIMLIFTVLAWKRIEIYCIHWDGWGVSEQIIKLNATELSPFLVQKLPCIRIVFVSTVSKCTINYFCFCVSAHTSIMQY